MSVRCAPSCWIAAIACIASLGTTTSAQAANKAQVTLLSSRDVIIPGKTFDVAIRFEQESGWHTYWQNSGDSGLPPSIHWKLPEGFTAAQPLFPIPKRHVSPGDIVTNILPGEPMLLVSLTSPASLPGPKAKLAAEVRYLICNQNCIQEKADVELELEVTRDREAVPANNDLFIRARRNLPKSDSALVTLKPATWPDTLAPGAKFEFVLTVTISPGHHLQSNTPTLPSLIPAEMFVERRDGVRLARAVYPEGKVRPDKYLGSLREYEGSITIKVPGEIDADRPPGPIRIAGVFSFQACDELGHCFPPEAVAFSLDRSLADASPKSTTAPPVASTKSEPASNAEGGGIEGYLKRLGLAGLLLGCFLYGLFINATPCVLPLLSIKVLGFVHQAHASKRRTLLLGLSFGAGVMVFFVVLGLLAAAGTNILQYPEAVIGLGIVVMAMGLSMLGVFTLQPPAAAVNLESHIVREGPLSSFGKGALAPVLGFACTGPLLAGAFGWATQQPRSIAVLAFLVMGLGMASPYMLLGARPHWLSFLPRPGAWMVVFERIMGFVLLSMVIWLLHPLVTQIGSDGLEWTLVFLIFVGLACWILGQVRYDMTTSRQWTLRGAAVALVVFMGGVIYEGVFPLDEAVAAARAEREALADCGNGNTPDGLAWRPWSAAAVEQTVRSGKLAFVDFTAAYCTICKVNKKIAINTPEFRHRAQALDAVVFQGDFTSGDDAIFAVLQRHGRAGVPLNLIYPPGKPESPLVLDPNLTKDYLLRKLDEAAAVRSASAMTLRP